MRTVTKSQIRHLHEILNSDDKTVTAATEHVFGGSRRLSAISKGGDMTIDVELLRSLVGYAIQADARALRAKKRCDALRLALK